MSIPHIVMMEDNLPDVMVFREALARRGIAFTIEHFSDGDKASAAIASMTESPALFVLDLNLPRVDGFALLCQIRQREATARTPVAVLTTSHAERDRSRCDALGADAYVVKPGDFTEFLNVVGSAVQFLLSGKAAGQTAQDPGSADAPTSLRRRGRDRARAAKAQH